MRFLRRRGEGISRSRANVMTRNVCLGNCKFNLGVISVINRYCKQDRESDEKESEWERGRERERERHIDR